MFGKLLKREKSNRSKLTATQYEGHQSGPSGSKYLTEMADFMPFNSNREPSNILALNFAESITVRKRGALFDVGEDDEFDYFLLDGEVTLTAFDDRVTVIQAKTDRAKNPLAYLRPRKYTGRISSDRATLLKLPHTVLETLYAQASANNDWGKPETIIIGQVHQETLLEKVEAAIADQSLLLPSLPEVALKVRNACKAPDGTMETIAKVVSQDSSISAKLVAAANSSLYRGAVETTTLQDAISRLGRQTTQQLVMYYATKEVFESPVPLLKQLFLANWHRSLERAVLAKTLAENSNVGLNPDLAFLCGLLMRVGDLVVFQYIAEVEEEPSELEKVSRIAEASSAKISSRLVQDWNLPDAILQAVKCGGRWDYTAESQPDYGELMVATNVHLRMLNNNMRGLPDLNEIPAITRIINDDFAPETSVILLAKQALEEYKAL